MEMDHFPKVSVIMSTHNDELYIREAINSILNQTFGDFEFLIIDDASSDSTAEIINGFNDNRIRLIRNEQNRGLTSNLNTLLKKAKGEYIARMDGDDISHLDRLQKQVYYLDANRDIYLIGTAVHVFGQSELYWRLPDDSENLKVRMLIRPVYAHPSFMFRRELITEGFMYDESFTTAQDYDFAVRVSRKHKIGRLQEVLLEYRTHKKQISNIGKSSQMSNADRIRKRQLDELGVSFDEHQFGIFRSWALENKMQTAKDYTEAYGLISEIVKGNDMGVFANPQLETVLKQMLYTWVIRSKKIGYILQFPMICLYDFENMYLFISEVVRTIMEKIQNRKVNYCNSDFIKSGEI